MGKLGVLSGSEVCAILAAHGFERVRQKGSHVAMQAVNVDGATQTVIVPDHDPLKLGTLRAIIRQSGLPKALFEVGG